MSDPIVETIIENGLVRLSDVERSVQINDMDYQFYYDRCMKPDNSPSDYLALHFKERQQERWMTCKNMLSSNFTVIKTQEVIQQIQSSLTGNIENEKHFRSGTSVKSTFKLSGYQIDIENEPEIDRVLFQLLTNINTDIELLTTNKLTFNIINGFSGNHALQLNYGLEKTMSVSNEDGTTNSLPVNNIFVLNAYTNRLIHDNRLVINISDVTNVQQNIQTQINSYKSVSFTPEFVDELGKNVTKRFFKKFISMFESIPDNLRNFYYVTYILSVIMESERNIVTEIKLRTLISKMHASMIDQENDEH